MHTPKWLITVLCVVSISFLRGSVHNEPDSTTCLEVEGKVLNADEKDIPVIIRLFVDDQLVDSVTLRSSRKKFRFYLSRDKHYTIQVSKTGFQTKNVCVHTHMSDPGDKIFQFYFEMNLLSAELLTPAMAAAEKLPVARIYYDTRKECFYYSRTNATNLNRETCLKNL